ncbi:MAG: hypothetical protein ACP5LH_03445 [Candidatus Micrarchaeia archaeon]
MLSLGAINAFIPLIIILILIVAAAGLMRGYDLFAILGLSTLLVGGPRGTLAGKNVAKVATFNKTDDIIIKYAKTTKKIVNKNIKKIGSFGIYLRKEYLRLKSLGVDKKDIPNMALNNAKNRVQLDNINKKFKKLEELNESINKVMDTPLFSKEYVKQKYVNPLSINPNGSSHINPNGSSQNAGNSEFPTEKPQEENYRANKEKNLLADEKLKFDSKYQELKQHKDNIEKLTNTLLTTTDKTTRDQINKQIAEERAKFNESLKNLTDSADKIYKIAHDDIKKRARSGLWTFIVSIKQRPKTEPKTFEAAEEMTKGASTVFDKKQDLSSSTYYFDKRHLASINYRHGYIEAVNRLHELKNAINKVKQT